MKRSLNAILLLILLASCQEEVFLELNSVEPRPVIEAFWTDAGIYNFVRLSTSRDFYSEEDNVLIENATVFIENEDNGQIFPFRFSQQAGRYLPINNGAGNVGGNYRLHVEWEDNIYESSGLLLDAPVLDSIVYNFRDERVFRESGYYLTLYGDIPFEDNNFYRLRVVRNDTLLNNRNDYLLFDDSFGTSILNRGFELSGFPFNANDRVRLELFRLNRSAFDYLNQLVGLLFNDGGLFSPPPQNPMSNIDLVAGEIAPLGYFKVSSVRTATIVVAPD
ncbi:DUF4249 domain-containing protein [Cecembia sp.]|uniref:DUF4249 domain-containing protein n=1 Tax=Cecembia sp. TaxID=1898110 RepID=UPI0025BCD2E9|nr:DUF4249 domain-containing protein [Cecembia sp.]